MGLELQKRVAVVTGASKGIGLAVVRTLLDEGAHVVAASRRTTPELDELAGELVHVPADLMDPDAPARILARAIDAFGRLGRRRQQRRRSGCAAPRSGGAIVNARAAAAGADFCWPKHRVGVANGRYAPINDPGCRGGGVGVGPALTKALSEEF